MNKYEKSYFTLFSAICDTIKEMESLLLQEKISEAAKQTIQAQIDCLKTVQQQTEEFLISE